MTDLKKNILYYPQPWTDCNYVYTEPFVHLSYRSHHHDSCLGVWSITKHFVLSTFDQIPVVVLQLFSWEPLLGKLMSIHWDVGKDGSVSLRRSRVLYYEFIKILHLPCTFCVKDPHAFNVIGMMRLQISMTRVDLGILQVDWELCLEYYTHTHIHTHFLSLQLFFFIYFHFDFFFQNCYSYC